MTEKELRGFAAVVDHLYKAQTREEKRRGAFGRVLAALRKEQEEIEQVRAQAKIDQIRVFKDNDHWECCVTFADGHSETEDTVPCDWDVEHAHIGARGAICAIAVYHGIKVETGDVVLDPKRGAVWTRPDEE